MENYFSIFIKFLINNTDFRLLIFDNWNKNYFDLPEERIIYQIYKNGWLKHKKIYKIKDIETLFYTNPKYQNLKDKLFLKLKEIEEISIDDYTFDFIKDYFIDILKKKNLQYTIRNIIDEIKKTDKIDESHIKDEILKSLTVKDLNEENELDYFDENISKRMERLKSNQISHFKTGLNHNLDKFLKLRRKTLAGLSAQLGVGKSLFLSNLAANFSLDGKNVIYFSLEMDKDDISERLDKILFGYKDDEYFYNIQDVENKMENLKKINKPGKLIIKSYSPRSLTSMHIRNLLEEFKLKNIKFDILLIDYLTLMRPNKTFKEENLFLRGKDVSEELSNVAKEENCLVFTVLQLKNQAYGKIEQGSEFVGESLAIPQTLDIHLNMLKLYLNNITYYMLSFEKLRKGKKPLNKFFLKMEDDLKMVPVNKEEEELLLEKIKTKKKNTNKSNFNDYFDENDLI